MIQFKNLWSLLWVRFSTVLVVGFIYGWAAPMLFGPHRFASPSRLIFLGVHMALVATAIAATLGRRPKKSEIICAFLAFFAWMYLFIDVYFNSFGS